MAQSRSQSTVGNIDGLEESGGGCGCSDGDNNADICFVEGSKYDKDCSMNENDVSQRVWTETRPALDFNEKHGNSRPLVSARKIDITRAVLNGKFQTPKSTKKPI